MPSTLRTGAVSAIDFSVRAWTPPPVRDQGGVVVSPGRALQREQPPALGVADRRVGIGVQEHVLMVEGRDQPGALRAQHPVAEHVPGHVTDRHRGEVLGLDVGAEFAKVAGDRLPCAARGDPHLLVVIAVGAAGRERIPEPEPVLGRHRVGDVGEAGGPLVGGDDEIRVVVVVADHPVGRADPRRACSCRSGPAARAGRSHSRRCPRAEPPRARRRPVAA